jgi:hypothetical protein
MEWPRMQCPAVTQAGTPTQNAEAASATHATSINANAAEMPLRPFRLAGGFAMECSSAAWTNGF